jgi:hypothetical protein
MIQLNGRQQFRNAAERAQKERMCVRRYERNVYEVTNRAKGHSYLVRFLRLGAKEGTNFNLHRTRIRIE